MQKAQILNLIVKIDNAMSKKWKFDRIGTNQGGVTEASVNTLISDYATAHPSTNVTDEHITELAKAYHDEHQVVVQQYPLVPEDQLEGE